MYVGNAYPHKNLERLIKATVLLNKKSEHKARLVIISGRSVFFERLNRTISKMGANDFVKVFGFANDKKLHEFYKNSKAFVFPSLSEGFGLPGIEAMDAGTLVLASDIPVFREVYDKKCIFFDPTSIESISDSMEKVLKMSESKRLVLIKNAKNFVKRYSWAKMAEETLKLYEETVQNPEVAI